MQLAAAIFQRDIDRDGWPTVAVVMAVRNEETHLEAAIEAILRQRYPIPVELCIAVGPSDDDTERVAQEMASRHPEVQVVTNPSGLTPAGLNAAIDATRSDVVVRVDGHSVLSDGYLIVAVETMIETGAVNVGGVQRAVGTTPLQRAVAEAMTSRIGTGGARFHVGGAPGPVDTVYLGVFDRSAGDLVGWFDERLVRNQDYELNIRLRAAGGVVWFTPALTVEYAPRRTWRGLAQQYFEYGYWKAQVLRMHPGSLKVRQAGPALLPLIATLWVGRATRRDRIGRLVRLASAGAAAVLVSSRVARVVAVQQCAWSAGFWKSVLRFRGLRSSSGTRSGG